LSRRLGIVALLVIATLFGSNHVAARFAIDHGTSVAAAVTVRSAVTAIFLLVLLGFSNISLSLERRSLAPTAMVGFLVAVQSFCLYSSVARIPVALALLVFNTYPMFFMLLSSAAGKEKLRGSALVAMPIALVGLTLALDVRAGGFSGRWDEIGVGVLWALGASVSFTTVLFCNAHWLKAMDGRLRTLLMMAVTAVAVGVAGAATATLRLPADPTGWIGLALLTILYGTAITSLFIVLPKLGGGAASTVAMNFEPIAVIGIAWIALGQSISPSQLLGAFIVVATIAWLGVAKR
jgi:drug/metabolite transporter (DMT)-like permease